MDGKGSRQISPAVDSCAGRPAFGSRPKLRTQLLRPETVIIYPGKINLIFRSGIDFYFYMVGDYFMLTNNNTVNEEKIYDKNWRRNIGLLVETYSESCAEAEM